MKGSCAQLKPVFIIILLQFFFLTCASNKLMSEDSQSFKELLSQLSSPESSSKSDSVLVKIFSHVDNLRSEGKYFAAARAVEQIEEARIARTASMRNCREKLNSDYQIYKIRSYLSSFYSELSAFENNRGFASESASLSELAMHYQTQVRETEKNLNDNDVSSLPRYEDAPDEVPISPDEHLTARLLPFSVKFNAIFFSTPWFSKPFQVKGSSRNSTFEICPNMTWAWIIDNPGDSSFSILAGMSPFGQTAVFVIQPSGNKLDMLFCDGSWVLR